MKKILFVDDMVEVYNKIKGKIKVDYSDNKKEAIEKINSNPYNLVVSDYHLGEESPTGGLNVVKAAKIRGIDALLISRYDQKKEALEAGVKFIFKKEFIENCGKKRFIENCGRSETR